MQKEAENPYVPIFGICLKTIQIFKNEKSLSRVQSLQLSYVIYERITDKSLKITITNKDPQRQEKHA